MKVPSKDVVNAAGSDELYLGFVWGTTRKILSVIVFLCLFGLYTFSHPFVNFQTQLVGILFVLTVILTTGKTYHFDAKTDLFRYHQTFMLLSLSWVEAGRVSEMRAAKFITRKVVDSESGHVKTVEELKLLFKTGEPFEFVSIFGRGRLEVVASKINRFLFNNRDHDVEKILNFSSKNPSQSIEVLDSGNLAFAPTAEESTERNAFW
jgi:hypothetical protein